jgi:hypothetical protein
MKARHGGSVKFRPALLVIWTVGGVLASSACLSATQEPVNQKKEPTAMKKAASGSSLSGCVDQQEGHYILVDDRNLSPVADLEADGFPTEGFAKHMGHKVTVRGTSNSASTRPVFKVRSIETISETCAPTSQSDKKQQ